MPDLELTVKRAEVQDHRALKTRGRVTMLQEGKPEEKTLICPLLATRPVTGDGAARRMAGAAIPNLCLREDCAWWNGERMECAVLSLVRISTPE